MLFFRYIPMFIAINYKLCNNPHFILKVYLNSAIGPKLAAHIHYFLHITCISFFSIKQIWAPMCLVFYISILCSWCSGLVLSRKICIQYVRFLFTVVYIVPYCMAAFYKMTCNQINNCSFFIIQIIFKIRSNQLWQKVLKLLWMNGLV